MNCAPFAKNVNFSRIINDKNIKYLVPHQGTVLRNAQTVPKA
jgi:hypothetical protein